MNDKHFNKYDQQTNAAIIRNVKNTYVPAHMHSALPW